MGPMRPVSQGGKEYVLTAIDDFSGYAEMAPLKDNSEAGDALETILLRWERPFGRKVKIVRNDRRAEYARIFCSHDNDQWCGSEGILRERSDAYKSGQNGRAERFNRTLTQKCIVTAGCVYFGQIELVDSCK
jgi:transposase InsO family protein